jgi:hypothetical protein
MASCDHTIKYWEDTGVPEVNHRPVASHWQNFKAPCKTLTLLYISQSNIDESDVKH